MAKKTHKVHAPVDDFDGTVAGAKFSDGVAEVAADDFQALAYFRRHGYGIDAPAKVQTGADKQGRTAPHVQVGTPLADATVNPDADNVDGSQPERPANSANKSEWEAYATARGIDVDGLTKNQIIEAVDAQEA